MVVDGYVRVSKVGGRHGDSFISPELQRDQIHRWAQAQGAVVAHVFEELDESGRRADRPLLEEAVQRVERGESEGIVVAYLSRFGRSLVDALRAIERITNAGGTFVSVQDGLDFSTDTGRLVLRFLFSVAEWELDRTSAFWLAAKSRAFERGVYIGRAPFGYRRGSDRRLWPDPATAPLVAELFRLRAGGWSIRELRNLLAERGIRSPYGNPNWDGDTLRGLLRRPLYLGEYRHGPFAAPKAHPALIDETTWKRAQTPMVKRPRRHGRPESVLAGLVRCAGCGRLLNAAMIGWGSSAAVQNYTCSHHAYSRRPCPAAAHVFDRALEPYVEAVFWQEAQTTRRPTSARRLARLEEVVARRERELRHYRDNARLPTTIGAEKFADGLAVRQGRLDRAKADLSQAKLTAKPRPLPVPELRARWRTMTNAERRSAMAEVIDCVFVSRGRAAIEERVFVCLRGQAPADLPGYHESAEPRPFDPSSYRRAPRLRPLPDWTATRLHGELDSFLQGWERWPSFPEFQAAGRALLHAQVVRHGGAKYWAARFDLDYTARAVDATWPEARVRTELAKYLTGKQEWPRERDLDADGRRALRDAVRASGGPKRWAPEFGLEPPQERTPGNWTYPRMKAELAEFTRGRKTWPAHREFLASGRASLYMAISKSGSREALAGELALDLAKTTYVRRHRWTEAHIEATLDQFLRGRTRWPRKNEFYAAGLCGLYDKLCKSGGLDVWIARYALAPPPRPRRLVRRWTDTKITMFLDEFLADKRSWPGKREFCDAGLRALYEQIQKSGRRLEWARRYGLPVNIPQSSGPPASS